MSSVTFNHVHRLSFGLDFFMTRWPVLGKDHRVVAQELLFRFDGNVQDPRHQADDMRTLLAAAADHGLARLLDQGTGYLDIDARVLLEELPDAIPRDRLVFTIHAGEGGRIPGLAARLETLAGQGMQFALIADAGDNALAIPDDMHALMRHAHTVMLDASRHDAASLASLCAACKQDGKTMVAKSVNSMEHFQRCAALGFDLFQGYYFAEPHFPKGKTLLPSQVAIAELMSLIASDADDAAIEHAIKMDVSLGLNLLRLVNTPAVSSHRIDSLRQALMVMGRSQLQRWLQVMLYSESRHAGHDIVPLLSLAASRGRLMELLAQSVHPSNRGMADTAFTVGIMSLMETLFSVPMADILGRLPVAEEVSEALIERAGFFGRMLMLVEMLERDGRGFTSMTPLMKEFRVNHSDLYAMQVAAYEWSDRVARIVR
jgi:c-di-GMP phosphodiesterase